MAELAWIEITPETVLPKGTDLIALSKSRRRQNFAGEPITRAEWHENVSAIHVARVGDICGEQHPDRDKLAWYSPGYTSASGPGSFTHYILLSSLPDLPPLPPLTPEQIEWSRKNNEAWVAMWKRAIPDDYVERLLRDK